MTEVRFRDFSRTPRDLGFGADGERYVCLPAAAPEVLQEMISAVRSMKDNPAAALQTFFELVLLPESAERIIPRLRKGHTNPLDTAQAIDICKWLAEEYSQRPTQQPSSSSNGSATGDAGTTSTDGQPPAQA